ncbi:hypothetical protein DV736_g2926, partial [Chaetothyriales sp. CBS 134916]
MASIADSLVFLYKLLASPTNPHKLALLRKQQELAHALIRTKQTHLFHFLDLPGCVRARVYWYIFAGNVVKVCSYNKDKTAKYFSPDERCQILLTCRQIWSEALELYYKLSKWKFVKPSSLNYFTWGVDDICKLRYVQSITITNQDALEAFADHLQFFPGLKNLVVDIPGRLALSSRVKDEDFVKTLRKIRSTRWWQDKVAPHLPKSTKTEFSTHIGIEMTYGGYPNNKEMWLVGVNGWAVTRNFRPVDPPVALKALPMPSSDDVDAEPALAGSSTRHDSLDATNTNMPTKRQRIER